MNVKKESWILPVVAILLLGTIAAYLTVGNTTNSGKAHITQLDINAAKRSGTVNNIEYGPCKSMRLEDVCEVAENGIRIRVTAPIDVNVIRTEHRDGILVIKFAGMPAGTCKRWITVPRDVLDGASEIIVKIGLSEMGRFAVNDSTCTPK